MAVESSLMILAVRATAFLGACFSLLKTLTIILLTLRFGTLTSLLHHRFLKMLNRIDILTIFAFTFRPAYFTLRETFTIFGLALRFRAFTAYFPFDFWLISVQGQQIVNLALG